MKKSRISKILPSFRLDMLVSYLTPITQIEFLTLSPKLGRNLMKMSKKIQKINQKP